MKALPYSERPFVKPFDKLRRVLRRGLRTGWFSNVGVQGQKGDKRLAESGDAPSRWLWTGFSTKMRKRREL